LKYVNSEKMDLFNGDEVVVDCERNFIFELDCRALLKQRLTIVTCCLRTRKDVRYMKLF